jgi:hypothetical protein
LRPRSLSGIDGIASRPTPKKAISSIAIAPSTSDIRKARQTAVRRRASESCFACKASRFQCARVHFVDLCDKRVPLDGDIFPSARQGQVQLSASVPSLPQIWHWSCLQ